jgi:hypothetical protein
MTPTSSVSRAPVRVLGLALASLLFSGAAGLATAGTGEPEATAAGVWQPRKIELVYLGFTSTYSCDGLQSKLELLLRQVGARPGFKVVTYGCPDGFGHPSKFVRADLEFASLQPETADATPTASAEPAPTVNGIWRDVEIAPHRPFDLQDGDCELIELFRDKVLPLFATRDPQIRTTCIPYQDTGGPYDLKLQVFGPVPVPKGSTASH